MISKPFNDFEFLQASVNVKGLGECVTMEEMTAMTFIEGGKITDIALTPEQRKNSARTLFRALIWRPLISLEEMAIFHGDPHAGNILPQRTISDRFFWTGVWRASCPKNSGWILFD